MTTFEKKNELIQIDLSQVMDLEASVYGYDGEKAIPAELQAEQRLEDAEMAYKDWLMGSLYPEVKEIIQKQIDTISDGGIHNTAAIQAEAERRAYFAKKYSLQGSIQAAKNKLEDTRNWIDIALVHLNEETEVQDLLEGLEVPEYTFTPLRGFWESLHYEFVVLGDKLSTEKILLVMDQTDDWKIRSMCQWILLERDVIEYKRLCRRIKKGKQWAKKFNASQIERARRISFLPDDKAVDFIFAGEVNGYLIELFQIIRLKDKLQVSIKLEHEKLIDKKIHKLQKTEEEFWQKEYSPWDIIDCQPGQDLSFQIGDEYLEGSCIEVKYVHRNGEVSYL